MLSPSLFHKIFGAAFFLLTCYAQGNLAGIPSVPDFTHLPEDGVDEGFLPDFPSFVDNEMEDIILQLEYQISRLEGVLRLEGKITAAGGKIFATNGKAADFYTTVQKCKQAGGSIATPRNQGENAAILYFVKQFNKYAYLGIKESLIPGKFHSLNGAELNYTNWYLREPSGKGKEECVEMYTDGTWNDKKCNQNHLIVCQF
ncbi:pulmonary surfactant-associated protein A-like [Apteryx rowi]|uniref:pulmonary surfactant-associated protein A-like n=1 Tax=Apteryx rowi TaxID=308060 RepID=UPI000E1DB0BF|nr:pulmonary surfactant-associated protein A-like [Apteryx rowi]